MASPLQHTLSRFVASRSRSNPAFNELFTDYRNYHVVLLAFGGLVEILVVTFCAFAWTKAKRAPRTETGKRTFEERTYLTFALFTTVIGLAFALVLVANVTTVLNPWPGFEPLVTSLGSPQRGSEAAKLFAATNAWIKSGSSTHMPAVIHAAVEHRLSSQRPLAIASTVLMVVFLVISVWIWRHLIQRSRTRSIQRRIGDQVLVLIGTVTVVATLLFTVLAVSNMRGTLEPVSITILEANTAN